MIQYIERDISRICTGIASALERVLNELGSGNARPQELSRKLNLNKSLTSRLCRVVRLHDPLAAACVMPGPEALRMFLHAAEQHAVEPASREALRMAINEFEAFVRSNLGDRATLDAVLSETLPDARTRFEMTNKQAAFRAMANLKGVRADVQVITVFVHPSDKAGSLDCVSVSGLLGLRRLRPSAAVQLFCEHLNDPSSRSGPQSLNGNASDGVHDLLLPEFCSKPQPALIVRKDGQRITYIVDGNDVGVGSAVDVVFAEYEPEWFRAQRIAGGGRTAGAAATVDQPAAMLLFDMFVHRDAWPGVDPVLEIFDTTVRGRVYPEDPSRTMDRLDLLESIRPLGWGMRKSRAAEVPRYLDILGQVYCARGWDAESFRGYRCVIRYPVYGSQVCMSFALPEQG